MSQAHKLKGQRYGTRVRDRKLRIYLVGGFNPRILAGRPDYFSLYGHILVGSPQDADILVAKRLIGFTDELLSLDRLNVVWTKEPFHVLENIPKVERAGRSIYIFNLFNGNVFTDNYFHIDDAITSIAVQEPSARSFNTPVVAVMTRKNRSIGIDGVDRSLTGVRERVALEGRGVGLLDIYGSEWADGVSVAESRHGTDRKKSKLEILKGYRFNLCYENCCWDYYVTEKIWDSIVAGCVPIYIDNGTIRQSGFMDAAILTSPEDDFFAIYQRIEFIGQREHAERLGELRNGHAQAVSAELGRLSRCRSADRFDAFIRAYA